MAGLYIHIPFCASRCIYCGFYSTTLGESLQDEYIKAVLKEYETRKGYLHDTPIRTIYIGGGTPSLLSPANWQRLHDGIIAAIDKDGIEEFTVECNPDDITPSLATLLFNIGVTRVSMGVQTFSDTRLQFLRRRHKASQIPEAIHILRSAGIENISIDLMFGFPSETLAEWTDDINTALALDVQHISAYSLMYEEGTPLYRQREQGLITEIDEDTSVRMYEHLITSLPAAGFEQYEISNFARPGYHSRHNSSYWNGTWYLGLGAAAHSYDGDTRGWNAEDIRAYITYIAQQTPSCHTPQAMHHELLDADTRYNDLVTTALRTKEGIDLSLLSEKYYRYIIRNAQRSIQEDLLRIDNNHLHLTRSGLYISDDVMSDLIYLA